MVETEKKKVTRRRGWAERLAYKLTPERIEEFASRGYVPTSECVRFFGLTRQTISVYFRDGILKGKRLGPRIILIDARQATEALLRG